MRLLTPADLFCELLRDAYSAETQLVLALPRVAARAQSPALQELLSRHLRETRSQAQRLEYIATILDVGCGGRRNPGMAGLLKEGDDALGYGGDPQLIDRAIMGCCARVERYEMAMYEAMLRLARGLPGGGAEIVELLTSTLDEEAAADDALGRLAQGLEPVPAAGA